MKKNTRTKAGKSKVKTSQGDIKLPKHLEQINLMAAGIDIGSRMHHVAVPEGCDEVTVREFATFTADLHQLANWLKKCKVTTVAMESTGVYWIPVYELLESEGFEVHLVDARKVKNVNGRKTDILDCQWLQELHTFGLLSGAFRPSEEVCVLRAYMRQRSMLIQQASGHIQRMQKALSQMNIQLHNVLSDITGETGMRIIRAIVAGERDSKKLATYRNRGCKNTQETIEKSLTGHYRNEHIFALAQALRLYDTYKNEIAGCDDKIEEELSKFQDSAINKREGVEKSEKKKSVKQKPKSRCKNAPSFDLTAHLTRITGVDLTAIPGIEAVSALKIISEIGTDLSRWKSSKQFASWLGLCPGNNVSGGKRLSSKTKRTANYASSILRLSANTLYKSQTALGACFRRLRARLGAPKAITALAHKLATIIYNMLTKGTEYREEGQDYYEAQHRDRVVKNLEKRAKALGLRLVENPC